MMNKGRTNSLANVWHKMTPYLCVLSIIIIVVACTPAPIYVTVDPTTTRYYKSGNVVEKDLPPSGEVYEEGKEFKWQVSYYGSEFNGRKTSSGEIYDMKEMTCAHRELPFNTVLEITNPDDKRQIKVRVNDRGPFIRGRDLDLSFEAAKQIGLLEEGVKELKIKIVELGD